MTVKKFTLPIIYIISLLVISAFLGGCASRKSDRIPSPEWFEQLVEKEDQGRYYFKVSAEADNRETVVDMVVEQVYTKLIDKSGKKSLYSNQEDVEDLKQTIRSIILNGSSDGSFPLVLERSEWVEQDGFYAFFGYFSIPGIADEMMEAALRDKYFGDDRELLDLLNQAEDFENNGKLYQAAESLLKAARYILGQETPLSKELAGKYVQQALEIFRRIEFKVQSYPESADANSKVSEPFSLRCMEGIIGLRDIEFLVEYQGKKRDGTIGTFEVRMVSDIDGYVNFYHPFLPFAGPSEVVMTPGSRTLKTILRELEAEIPSAGELSRFLDESAVSMAFTVNSIARKVSTGIVVLHTDMTGANLDSSETANGLREVLSADGFDVEVMDLSPREITASNEQSFLRDLKAAYNGIYKRVIFGVVGINDFEIRNETVYMVETSGVIKVVDVATGEILMELDGVKSVESRDNALAVAASFKELGKAFGQELTNTLY